jgi:hypothetical protein
METGHRLPSPPDTRVRILVTDTRSLPEREACHEVRERARRLREQGVVRVFKKIDSALRGHILAELAALQEYFPAKEVWLLPGNPESGRIIRNGIYYIHETPLHQTAFAADPDFPARTSVVRERVGNPCPPEVITPDLLHTDDYAAYARRLRPGILPVGGSVFFEACLQAYFPGLGEKSYVPTPIVRAHPMLMVCGSAHENSRRFIQKDGFFTKLEIPRREIASTPPAEALAIWNGRAISSFNLQGRLLLFIGDGKSAIADRGKKLLAGLTKTLLQRCAVAELLIEGGATAYTCLQTAGLAALVPVDVYARGVVRFRVMGKHPIYLTIKPGSYEWPANLFQS